MAATPTDPIAADPAAETTPDTSGRDARASQLQSAIEWYEKGNNLQMANKARKALTQFMRKNGMEGEVEGAVDWNSQWDTQDANFMRRINNKLRGPGNEARPAAWANNVNRAMTSNNQRIGREEFERTATPVFERVNKTMNELLNNPNYSAEDIAAQRSEMISGMKAAEQTRMKRVAATFGLRGMSAESPAAQYAGTRAATEGDALLQDMLRKHGLELNENERQSQFQEMGLAQEMVTKQNAITKGLRDGDAAALMQLNADLGDLMEAIRVQKEMIALQRDMEREQRGRDREAMYKGMGMDAVKLGLAPFTSGASMMIPGGTFTGGGMNAKDAGGFMGLLGGGGSGGSRSSSPPTDGTGSMFGTPAGSSPTTFWGQG